MTDSNDPFHIWWVERYEGPPRTGLERCVFKDARVAWNRSKELAEETIARELYDTQIRVRKLEAALVAASDGVPVVTCPNCGSPTVDLDGSGLLVCPRDPLCYCLHPSSDLGTCNHCGRDALPAKADHERKL